MHPQWACPTDMLRSNTDDESNIPGEGNANTCVSTPGCTPVALASFGDPFRWRLLFFMGTEASTEGDEWGEASTEGETGGEGTETRTVGEGTKTGVVGEGRETGTAVTMLMGALDVGALDVSCDYVCESEIHFWMCHARGQNSS